MPKINGIQYSREDFLRHLGNFSHVAGITPLTFDSGRARGTRLLRVATGSGLEFDLLPDRCLDILALRYRGITLSQMAKNGPTAPASGLPAPGFFPAAISGGMMFTGGLLNAGGDCVDAEGRFHTAHGNIGLAPAEELTAGGTWEGDEYIMRITGRMRESRLFHENLTLTRTVTTRLGSDEIELYDVVENLDSEPVEYAILYHCNFGFPFLSPELCLKFTENRITPRTPEATAGLAAADRISEPVDDFFEHVFFRDMQADPDGFVTVRAENPTLGIAAEIRYEQKNLPCFVQWKSMRSGDYALGLEPSNTILRGRAAEHEAGALPTLPGFGRVEFRLKFSFSELAK